MTTVLLGNWLAIGWCERFTFVATTQQDGLTRLIPSLITLVTMLASFELLSVAMRTLLLSSAYTIWTGIGAVGAFIVGVIWLGKALA